MDFRRLDAPFGVEVLGANLARDGQRSEVLEALVDALHTHRVVVIRDQILDSRAFADFGTQWGDPIVHALSHGRADLCPDGVPEVLILGNTGRAGQSEKHRMSAVFWHTDQAYEDQPASATMLYCLKAPRVGGQTQLTDMVAAYDALPGAIKTAIDGLVAVHSYAAGSGRDGEYNAAADLTPEDRARLPAVRHPLVIEHPFTGRKALYAVAGTPFEIDGLPSHEAETLLSMLKHHALQPQFRYDHFYEVGDVAIWDTFATMHSAVPIGAATGEQDARLVWRISCRGAPAPMRERRREATSA